MNKKLPLTPIESDAMLYVILSVLLLFTVTQVFSQPAISKSLNSRALFSHCDAAGERCVQVVLQNAVSSRNSCCPATVTKTVLTTNEVLQGDALVLNASWIAAPVINMLTTSRLSSLWPCRTFIEHKRVPANPASNSHLQT